RRDDRVRKDALRRRAARRRVVWLARRNAVPESLTEDARPVRPVDGATELVGGVREIARAIEQRRHRNVARLDSLCRARGLVIAEKADLSSLDRSVDNTSSLTP